MSIILVNGKPAHENEKPLAEPNSANIYEVVRAQSGVVLFAENHLARLNNSLAISGVHSNFAIENWLPQAYDVLRLNNEENINLRFDYNCNDGKIQHSVISTIPSTYPTAQQRKNGIAVCLYNAERHSPNAKITDLSVRGTANQLIADTLSYEALLVNANGEITEGSRSNFFAILNSRLVTAPNQIVLQGIMREQVLKIATLNQFTVEYRPIKTSEIPMIEGAFITGTSPRVLAINSINHLIINHNNFMTNLLFDKIEHEVAHYIAKHKR